MVLAGTLASSLVVGGCRWAGYTALETGPAATPDFQAILVGRVDGRDGQLLRNFLLEQLYHAAQTPRAVKKWGLEIELLSLEGTQTTFNSSRNEGARWVRGRAVFRLYDLRPDTRAPEAQASETPVSSPQSSPASSSGRLVLRRTVVALSDQHFSGSHYRERLAQDAAREAVLAGLAREIAEALALHFASPSQSQLSRLSRLSRSSRVPPS